MSKVRTQLIIDGKNNSKKAFDQVNRDLGKMSSEAKAAGAAIIAALGSGAFAAWIAESARAVSEMNRLAQASNTSAEAFQKWSYAARSLGIEQDKLGDIFKDVQDKVGDFLQTGGGELKDFFEKIAPAAGVTAEQFRQLSGPDALQLYVKTLQRANLSHSEMTFYLEAIANDASLLLPLLTDNAAKLEAMGDHATELGRVLDEETVRSIDSFHKSLNDVGGALDGFGNQLTGMIGKTNEAAGVTDTLAGSIDRLSGVLAKVSATKAPSWLDKFSETFRLLGSPKLLDGALNLLVFGRGAQQGAVKAEADQYGYREELFSLHTAEMALLRAKDVADTELSQKKVIAATETVLKKQVALEKTAAADLEKAKQAQLDTYKRYADALASINAGTAGDPSYGAAQSLKVGAREALRAGDIEGAKQQAQAALKMLQDLAAAGGNTYGFKGFIEELQTIEQTADSQMLDGMQEAFDKAQAGAKYLQAELEKLKKSPVSLEMDQASLDAVKAQITRLAGEKIVIPVTFDSSGQNYAQPYTLQDPGPEPTGYATGGYISGPGTGTSDSIPALLSNGEYVIRADAVRKLGKRHLDMLNRGIPIPRFADGGMVGTVASLDTSPRNLGSLDINLGSDVFQVFADAGQADGIRLAAKKFGRTKR